MDKMTVFFNKRTGNIRIISGGEQTMNIFGEEKQDYELIYDFIVLEFDRYVLENSGSFYVDENRELKFRNADNLTKYM
jgi:hypothetical protein